MTTYAKLKSKLAEVITTIRKETNIPTGAPIKSHQMKCAIRQAFSEMESLQGEMKKIEGELTVDAVKYAGDRTSPLSSPTMRSPVTQTKRQFGFPAYELYFTSH